MKIKFLCNADVGRFQPVEEPEHGADELAERAVGRVVLRDLDMAKTLSDLRHHIEGLTFGIMDFWIKELPIRLQRYTIGVPNH